ncbi:hypothetical protein D623_10001702 [Myotis brandtii]|uniref:Uncharacterized protein n=1 Tax=Myotis brandtii TaxID=109478 RepID=S7MXZ6_MYOBR|nr:hypothetical protein D623_10001702 [Myotis brandtii]
MRSYQRRAFPGARALRAASCPSQGPVTHPHRQASPRPGGSGETFRQVTQTRTSPLTAPLLFPCPQLILQSPHSPRAAENEKASGELFINTLLQWILSVVKEPYIDMDK